MNNKLFMSLLSSSYPYGLLNFKLIDSGNAFFDYTDITGVSCDGVRSPDIFELDDGSLSILYVPRYGGYDIGIYRGTTTKSDILNWTNVGRIVQETGKKYRSASHVKVGNTWYVVADTLSDGYIYLFTGTDLDSLTAHPSNPVFTGNGTVWEEFVRHPDLHYIDGLFYLFYDGRTVTPAGTDGGGGYATSPDCVTWTRWSGNPLMLHDTYWYHNYQNVTSVTKLGEWYYYTIADELYTPSPPSWTEKSTSVYVTKDFKKWRWLTPNAGQIGDDGAPAEAQHDIYFNDYDNRCYSFALNYAQHGIGARATDPIIL